MSVNWAETDYPFGAGAGSIGLGVQLEFDVASVGGGNTDLAVVARIPLTANYIITGAAVVCQASLPGCLLNVYLNAGAGTTVPGSGTVASTGSMLFSSDVAIPNGDVTVTYNAPTAAIWPQGNELTLRVNTVAYALGVAAVSQLKIALLVQVL